MIDQYDWLDKIIIEQANHYNMSPKAKAELFSDAAEYCEFIEQNIVEEPNETITQRQANNS